jgi:hypothetical protein
MLRRYVSLCADNVARALQLIALHNHRETIGYVERGDDIEGCSGFGKVTNGAVNAAANSIVPALEIRHRGAIRCSFIGVVQAESGNRVLLRESSASTLKLNCTSLLLSFVGSGGALIADVELQRSVLFSKMRERSMKDGELVSLLAAPAP